MLITCPECKKEVSDLAFTCPGCGFPIKQKIAQHASPPPVAPNPQTAAPLRSKHQCPQCQSGDVKSFRMIHSEGVSQSTGIGWFSQTQSNLAMMTTPPDAPVRDQKGCITGFLLLMTFAGVFAFIASGKPILILPLAAIVLPLMAYYSAGRKQAARRAPDPRPLSDRLDEYEHRWVCLRCGARFLMGYQRPDRPVDPSPESVPTGIKAVSILGALGLVSKRTVDDWKEVGKKFKDK